MDDRRKAITIPRGFDHLDTIETILRNLQGYGTLAYELIQNADDVPGTTTIGFDITAGSLVVDNDGVFSDCGQVLDPECPWRDDPSRGYRCDFHRLRIPAGSDKRRQTGTTGKFGVGLIAVYQVTDRPQVVSNGRHWTIYEELSDIERIQQCPGCAECDNGELPGTRFILPWANDPSSHLRKALHVGAVTPQTRQAIAREWESSLINAMVFLKRLTKVEIRQDGRQIKCFKRDSDEKQVLLEESNTDDVVLWTLVTGGFPEVARRLQQNHPSIETQRSSDVRIAIPGHEFSGGRLYACLPTQHLTGLPFHIDADFFPASDRKQVVFEEDYQSEWNRAAIEAAAEALRDSVDSLPDMMGAERLWHLMLTCFRVSRNVAVQNQDRVFAQFWEKVEPVLKESRTMWTERKEFRFPPLVPLLKSVEEEEAVPALDSLGVDVAHRDLRPYLFELPRSETLGMTQLGIRHVIDGLRSKGLTKRTALSCCPKALQNRHGLTLLWRELTRLLQRESDVARTGLKDELANYAIALGKDDALWPCKEVYRAHDVTMNLFSKIAGTFPFLSDMGEDGRAIAELCPSFDSSVAVDLIQRVLSSGSSTAARFIERHPDSILGWFESRRDELLGSPALKQALIDLPIYPGQDRGLKSLSELALPGDFEDPVGITDLIDLKRLGNRKEFLIDLGKQPLTFGTYVRDHLSVALNSASLSRQKKRDALLLLAAGLGQIKDDDGIRSLLRGLPLVEVQKGEQEGGARFAKPEDVYMPGCAVEEILGSGTMIALLPKKNREAIRDLYQWLGVEDKPRFSDVQNRILSLTSLPPNDVSRAQTGTIVRHLGERYRRYQDGGPPSSWGVLRTQEWLPVQGRSTRWYSPGSSQIYSVFQDYLFKSQGLFLDIDRTTQNEVAALLKWLGVRDEPEPHLVVKHLIHCSSQNLKVNNQVYVYLNRYSDHATITGLIGRDCLLLPDGKYVAASKLFRTDHPFGKYRYRLSPDMAPFDQLLERLGVLHAPRPEDAIAVLGEIGADWGHKPLDPEAHAICINCWLLLARKLAGNNDDPHERKLLTDKVSALRDMEAVPNSSQHILCKTRWILFDDRTGIASAFGSKLRNNLVDRHPVAWPAMQTAGVRTLTVAADVQLLECDSPVDDQKMYQLLKNRRSLIQRVLESRSVDSVGNGDMQILDNLKCFRVDKLIVRYDLDFDKTTVSSDSCEIHALVRRGDPPVLYYVSQGNMKPWTAIAKELAQVLEPGIDPGQIASGIKEVVSAASDVSAEAILDELGFAPLDTRSMVTPGTGELVSSFGVDAETTPCEPSAQDTEMQRDEAHRAHGVPQTGERVEQASKHLDSATMVAPGSADSLAGTRIRTGSKLRLRTYVLPPDHKTGEEDPSVIQRRKQVDAAGVKCVMRYERAKARLPVKMKQNHPGWDIESKDAEGRLVRYIEVKSTEGIWDDQGVGLTQPQFEKASMLGALYWLYVVENALGQDPAIHRVQNPAKLVNQFLYDRGWQQLAENG